MLADFAACGFCCTSFSLNSLRSKKFNKVACNWFFSKKMKFAKLFLWNSPEVFINKNFSRNLIELFGTRLLATGFFRKNKKTPASLREAGQPDVFINKNVSRALLNYLEPGCFFKNKKFAERSRFFFIFKEAGFDWSFSLEKLQANFHKNWSQKIQ